MNLPSFAEFKRSPATYYSFATILALIFIFNLYKTNQEEQIKTCKAEKEILQNKLYLLQDKILIIMQKEKIKDSIK